MTLLYGDALEIIESRIAGIAEIERIRLSEAAGRVLAADLIAKTALPPADASAMDGFAFAFTPGVTRYRRMAGRSAAGHPFDGVVPPGHALRILTGAMMPPGTDTVATQESCTVTEDGIEVPASLSLGANRRLCGEDVRAGSVVLTKGTRLTAPALGLAAAAGFGEVTVARRLRVAVFSTGDHITGRRPR